MADISKENYYAFDCYNRNGLCYGLYVAVLEAAAVGKYVVGQEKCDTSSLTAKGVIPDTVNKITEVFAFQKYIVKAIDAVAVEVKAILGQFGIETRSRMVMEEVKATSNSKRKIRARLGNNAAALILDEALYFVQLDVAGEAFQRVRSH